MFVEQGQLIGLKGKRIFIVNVSGKKEWIPGLGVIETSRFLKLSFGDTIKILDHEFLIVRPSLEDILSNMEKITQTISIKDIGFMLLKSGVRPGSTVAEVGVGSGYLSVSILYYIIPGILYGFDSSSSNLEHVSNIMKWLGWDSHFISIKVDERINFMNKKYDAIFLDIPDPSAISRECYESIYENGRIIAYLPNINQVHLFAEKIKDTGAKSIEVYEIISRQWKVGQRELRPINTGLLHTAFIVVVGK
jgi:tRNA (adenine57-N1/adenine58-N1)-methyltransferase